MRWRRFFRAPRSRSLLVAAFTLILLSSVAWWATGRYEARLLAERRADVALENSLYGNALSAIVNRRLARLQGLYAYAQSTPHDGAFAAGFDNFASGLFAASQGIRSFAVAPAGTVDHVYPLFGNETVLGYEPLKDPFPEIRGDAQLALRTGLLVLSTPYHSVDGDLQLVAQQAVYNEGHFWGFVRIVLDLPFLLEEAGLGADSGELRFALRTGEGRAFYGDPAVFSAEPVIGQIALPGTYWELAAVPVAGWESEDRQPLRLAQTAGAVIVALLTSLTFLTVNHQQRLSFAVQQRTREITRVNEALQRAIAERALAYQDMEQRVVERTRELSGLYAVTSALLEKVSLNEVLEVVCVQAQQLTGAVGSTVWLLAEGDGQRLQRAFTRGEASPPYEQLPLEGSASGASILQRQPLLINDLPAQAAGFSFTGSAFLESLLSVPLLVKGAAIGALNVVNKPGGFTEDDIRIIRLFADQAAMAIESARLAGKAEQLAVMEERTRLARDLHDSVTQSLYSLTLFAEAGRAHAARGELQRLQHQLQRIGQTAQHALAEMRLLLHELRPPLLEQEGLTGALHRRLDAVERRAGHQARLLVDELPLLSPLVEECLYRIATEALNNTLKHARASTVTVYLCRDGDWVVLEIVDDGVGFEVDKASAGGLGLTGMRERVERCHGSLTVCSTPGAGTRVTARLKSEDRPETIQTRGE